MRLENDHFIVNTYCPVTFLMQHIRAKLGLAESELIDLCDKQGAMTCLFLPQNTQKWAHELLKPRESFIVCSVNRESDASASLYICLNSLQELNCSVLLSSLFVHFSVSLSLFLCYTDNFISSRLNSLFESK
ncbi:hypothetical protein IRJ41_021051 [Triplophysa rosa]|uniref:Uncharacterized protein n=1 Tax=Triplophysa rosa TaxID=992332 RepID=A0A9W7TN11_TRIRA|nr:hypothetical protein IRJ41_021051 [Triplophysa rosa]